MNKEIEIKEKKLKEQFDKNTEFEPKGLIYELKNTVHSNNLQLIDIATQKLRIRVADQYYLRVYHISGTDDMFVSHVDVGMMEEYYLDEKQDLFKKVSKTVSDLAGEDSYFKVEKNDFKINLGEWI